MNRSQTNPAFPCGVQIFCQLQLLSFYLSPLFVIRIMCTKLSNIIQPFYIVRQFHVVLLDMPSPRPVNANRHEVSSVNIFEG